MTVAGSDTPTIGFTGHVNDVDTGLTYMQQRYYDPVAGRFLSEDPVTTDANTGASFNRYTYANNNPYKFVDPDGANPEGIAKAALSHKGESGWGKPGWRGPPHLWRAFKCSIFVNQVVKEAGDQPPMVGDRPALAGELADKTLIIANWVVVTDGTIKDGDIIALQEDGDGSYTGHTGIIKYGGSGQLTLSADSNKRELTYSDWGFRDSNWQGQSPTFRRYIPGQGNANDPSTKPKPKQQPDKPNEFRPGHE